MVYLLRGLSGSRKVRITSRGVEIETVPLKFEIREGWLYEIPYQDGMPTRIVTKIDGNAFNEYWRNILCS